MGDVPLFDGYEPADPAPGLSPQQRLTVRQAQQIAIGRHPLTGGRLHPLASRHRDAQAPKTDPFTCGSCRFRVVVPYHNRTYPKCLWYPPAGTPPETLPLDHFPRVAHSAASDVRAWWPACPDYQPGDQMLSPDAHRSIPGAD